MTSPFAAPLTLAAETGRANFVDIDVGAELWIGLCALIAVLLGIDLYRHRKAHVPTTRETLLESSFWVFCGLAFGGAVLVVFGTGAFGEYLSGYLTEKALSVDNVFVWSIMFSTLRIPVAYQHRVLFWGIFGALALRAGFIFAGSALLNRFEVFLIVFGVFLVYTGLKLIRHKDDEGKRGSTFGMGLVRKVMHVSDEFDGQRFFTRLNGKLAATPLLAALVVVEVTDLIFAVDSVPAILALSSEEFLIFASNAFAILGLRALYFLLADARERFHYLNHALGAILVFVGAKMIGSYWFHLDVWLSLGVIVVLLVAAIIFSERYTRRLQAQDAASGGPNGTAPGSVNGATPTGPAGGPDGVAPEHLDAGAGPGADASGASQRKS